MGKLAVGEIAFGEVVSGKLRWGNNLTPEKINISASDSDKVTNIKGGGQYFAMQ